jgi:dTDP-glucose pyrophosphorylase
MKINEAVILAGGLGTRLRSVVSGIPKPMAPIKSKPFLEYLINYWSSQGITHFVFSTGYLSETIESYFKNHWGKSTISYSREKSPLGTGGALAQAIRQIQSDNTLVLNGDTYCEVPLAELEAAHHHQKSDITLVMSNGVHAGVGTFAPGFTVAKVAKPRQDLRFDVPVVGLKTLEALRSAGAGVLAVEAKKTLFFDKDEFLKGAREMGLVVMGVTE